MFQICTNRNNCNSGNINEYILKDYPRYYSGDGMPPSGTNPYHDEYHLGSNNQYYRYIRNAVAPYSTHHRGVGTMGGISNNKYKIGGQSNYTPLPKIVSNTQNIATDLLPDDTKFNIYNSLNQHPFLVRPDYYNDYGKFSIEDEKMSPRDLSLHPKKIKNIRNHYYYPRTKNNMGHMPYMKTLYHKKYATAEENKQINNWTKKSIYDNDDVLPNNHVEWKGRIYDCDKLTPTKWCLDPIYGSEVHGKCEAQKKYLGRTHGGKCSLTSACLPQADITNDVECIKSIEDADRRGLLTNTLRPEAKCHIPLQLKEPSQLDYWYNNAFLPIKDKLKF